MAVEIREFSVTIPANTPISAGFAASLAMPTRVVSSVEVFIPPGPRGEVGWALASGGVQMFPLPQGTWVITDDRVVHWDLSDAIDSGAWQMLAYNTGLFPHTLIVIFYLDLVPLSGQSTTITTGTSSTSTGVGTTPPPPVITTPPPPTLTLPVTLPPSLPPLPGAPPPPVPEQLLIGVADLGQVWLLDENGYSPVTSQDDVTAYQNDGIAGVELSTGTHDQILATAGMPATMTLGDQILSGYLIPPRRVVINPPLPPTRT